MQPFLLLDQTQNILIETSGTMKNIKWPMVWPLVTLDLNRVNLVQI